MKDIYEEIMLSQQRGELGERAERAGRMWYYSRFLFGVRSDTGLLSRMVLECTAEEIRRWANS